MRGQWKLDAVYILAKELAYNVLNTRKTELKTALGKASGAGMAKFAEALHTHHAEIDKKLCKNGTADGEHTKYGLHKSMGSKGAEKWPKISSEENGNNPGAVDATDKISGEMVAFNAWGQGKSCSCARRYAGAQKPQAKCTL